MIKEDLTKGQLISGSGRTYRFDSDLYMEVANFLAKKFEIDIEHAKSQLNYYLVSAFVRKNGEIVNQYSNDLRSTNARLKNIIELDYEWRELFYV